MNSRGFTMIETIVALGIFSVLFVAVTAAFGNGYASQRKVLEMQAVQRDGAYILEVMSREIRMASNPPSQNALSTLTFTNHGSTSMTYCRARLYNGDPVCTGTNSGDFFAMINNSTGVKSVMNSSAVKVTNLMFYPSSGDYGSSEPMVTISMTLQSTKDASVKMTMQTSVSMRLYYLH